MMIVIQANHPFLETNMKCPTCSHDPADIQQKRAAVSRWSGMTKKERSAEMSRVRKKGIKKPKRAARRSND